MDGLLVDSERYMWGKTLIYAGKLQGCEITDDFYRSIMGLNRRDVSKKFKDEFGEKIDIDEFFRVVERENSRIMKEGIPLMKGAKELLDFLKQEGIKICVGTSTGRSIANDLLTADNLMHYFDGIVCGDEVKHGKPEPDIYLTCFEKFDVKKEETLIFEDADAGAFAAFAAGIRLVLVPDLAYVSKEAKARAFKVLDDLSQIIDVIKEENERTTCI